MMQCSLNSSKVYPKPTMSRVETPTFRKQRRCLFKVMAGALASHADAFAVLVKQDGNGHKRAGEKCKEGAGPTNAEVNVHCPCEEGEPCAEHGTNKVVSCENAGGVGRICVREVVQHDVLWRRGITKCQTL